MSHYKVILGFLLLCFSERGMAQETVPIKNYTINDGLPSNHIYKCLEDNNGFLWIATDNGVSRFDGKYFQNFSINNGLPDNEVIDIVKDKYGTIWANTFKNLLSYFDEVQNKFVVPDTLKYIKLETGLAYLFNYPNGCVGYRSLNNIIYFDKKKIRYALIENDHESRIKMNDSITFISKTLNYHAVKGYNTNKIYYAFEVKKYNSIISREILNFPAPQSKTYVDESYVYLTPLNRIYITSISHKNAITIDSLVTDEKIFNINSDENNLYAILINGDVEIFDKKQLTLKQKVTNTKNVNTACKDHFNNIWIGTSDRGLTLYKNVNIKAVKLPATLKNNNFLSIDAPASGGFLAGNFNGEIVVKKDNKTSSYALKNKSNSSVANYIWIRRNIYSQHKIFSFSDNFILVDNKRLFDGIAVSNKAAVQVNDSIIIKGGFSSVTGGLVSINTKTEKTKLLNFKIHRVSALAKYNSQYFYVGTLNGVYKYDFVNDITLDVFKGNAIMQNRIIDIKVTADSLVCVATSNNKILILKNDTILDTIDNADGFNKSILSIEPANNQIWIGTREGISIMKYDLVNSKLVFKIFYITTNDGLPSNVINDLAFTKDSMLVATDNGIAILPVNQAPKSEDIPVQLTKILINQKEESILENYKLSPGTKFINLTFAGINLNGNFKNLIYAINDTVNWNSTTDNNLNIQLENGESVLYVKANSINEIKSSHYYKISFDIHSPFYTRAWFWVLIASLFPISLLYYFQQKKIAKQKRKYQQQLALDQQRLKITADLHDDIGASLSSLQVNSAVANQLITTKPLQAKQVLDKIEEQSKRLSDNIGDIIWSMKPGRDEFMTLSSRIKTFASDIIGSTNANYFIQIDKEADEEIKDFTTRKNIVLIIKEAVNNAVKYSGATQINISLLIKEKTACIIVADNGKGINPNEPAGNGLINMKKRAEELNGKFTITSEAGSGTSVISDIPVKDIQ